MARLLQVIANPKTEGDSVSRRLATHFLRYRRVAHPDEAIETLDLYREDVPPLDAVTAAIVAARPDSSSGENPTENPVSSETSSATAGPPSREAESPPPSWALAASDRFTAQFLRADRVVIVTPLWNFGPPAILKAWIDLIVRQDRTFAFTETGIRPLAPGKRVLVIGARGGVYSGESPLRNFDFLEPYLRGLFGVLGADLFDSVWSEGTSHPKSPEAIESHKSARERLRELARDF